MSILLDSFLLLLVYFSAVFIVFLCFFVGFSFSFVILSDNRKCIFGLYLAISSTNFYLHWVANFPTLQTCLISYRTCVNSHIEHYPSTYKTCLSTYVPLEDDKFSRQISIHTFSTWCRFNIQPWFIRYAKVMEQFCRRQNSMI